MANRFDLILDDCIDRIAFRGETVEGCLERYPEHAAELEPYLQMAAKVAQSYAFAPSSTAKEQGRQRLRAEQRALQQEGREKYRGRLGWRWWKPARLPRWATGLAAVILVILVGTSGTVIASANTLPGDVLYPVKRGVEQIQLALPLPSDTKARLNLAYAERRAEEMAALTKEGKTVQLPQLGEDLRQSLDSTTRVLSTVNNEQEVASVKSQVQQSASQALNKLQVALQEAPEADHQAASESFHASSQAYGEVVEKVMAQGPKPPMAAELGTLRLLATDPSSPAAEKVLLTVSDIEAYLSLGSNSRWITISQEPQTFDLLQIAGMQKSLAEKQVEPGTYTRVRFHVTAATVVVGGVEHPAKVPSESLSLIRPFQVEEGETTSVVLDFDGSGSLHMAGPAEFVIKPVVNVLVHGPSGQEKHDKGEGRGQEKGNR